MLKRPQAPKSLRGFTRVRFRVRFRVRIIFQSRAFSHARGLVLTSENPLEGEDSDNYLYTVHYTVTGSNSPVKRAGQF